MPRAEFARFGSDAQVTPESIFVAPRRGVSAPPPSEARSTDSGLRILLLEDDAEAAADISALLADIFGDHCTRDRVNTAAEAIALIHANRYDVYLVADKQHKGNAVDVVRSTIAAGCDAPIIVLATRSDAGADLKAVEAGAADYLPRLQLSAAMLGRSIRHALVRQHGIIVTRKAIEGLTTEKARLNTLRDANHRFVENACHDFRSPLTVIKEFASIIADGLAGEVNEEQSEFLGIILTRVDHLSHMVDGILDASRLESDLIGVKREERSVAGLIEGARSTLVQRASAHAVEIEFAVPDTLPNVFADAESIGRVIINLGSNACKYAGENCKIRVWARYEKDQGAVTIGVTDNGPGIAPEHVRIIFDRFQQTGSDEAAEKGGFGLGLHIASELVRVNFGTLTVESEPHKGSTFAFTLPIFDVNALIPLHFAFLRTSRHGFRKVSLAMATATSDSGAPLVDVERALNRQLRSYDLLLRVSEGNWLVCIACDEEELPKITDRIVSAYALGRSHRTERLPELRFRPVGTWTLASRAEGLTEAIRGAYQWSPESGVVH